MSTNIPTRFQDPREARDFTMKLLGMFIIDGDPTPSQSEIERMSRALTESDDLADAVVTDFKALAPGESWRLLNQALDSGIESVKEAPESLQALFAQLDKVPAWVDFELADHASVVAQRTSFFGEFILSCVSLMGGYRSSAANKPIAMTGALTYNARRRLAETSQFTYNVTRAGAMRRHSQGFKEAVKVRFMHAFVRNKLKHSSEWRADEWGEPINQADLVGTNLLFSLVFLMGLRLVGFRFDERDSLATMHLWRYIGYVMGISEELLPADEEAAQRLAYLIGNSQPGADADSLALGQALMNVPFEQAETPAEQFLAFLEMHYRSGLSRLVLGDQAGDDLGLPNTPLKYAPLLTTPLIFTAETIRMMVPGLTDIIANLGESWQSGRIKSMIGDNPAQFRPPAEAMRATA